MRVKKKRFLGILPGLVMALVLMLGMSLTAKADIRVDETEVSSTTTSGNGWSYDES